MLATLTDRRFSDQNWILERKLDGERCVAYRDGDTIELKSRNRKILNDHYPELAEALAMQSEQRFIVDGEIVAFDGRLTSFSQLQKRMHIEDPELSRRSGVKVYLYVFDSLYLGRSDVSEVSQRDRKTLLKRVFSYADPLRYTTPATPTAKRCSVRPARRAGRGSSPSTPRVPTRTAVRAGGSSSNPSTARSS
jgi:ATP-dependent DNA ligase